MVSIMPNLEIQGATTASPNTQGACATESGPEESDGLEALDC